jgi:hypothetical protein
MFLLFMQHGHHLATPLVVLAVVATIGLRLLIRRGRGRGPRGGGPFAR